MKQTRILLYTMITVAALAGTAYCAMAQAPGDTGDADQNDVPIDGGVSLLVGAAAVYGAKKLKAKE